MEALSCIELTDLSRGLAIAYAYMIGYANSDAHHHRAAMLIEVL
jgi:hypothetical protein